MSWDRVRSSYDEVADLYETRFIDELDGKQRDREILAAFAAAADDPVVEVGCGPGQIGAYVRARDRSVVGADLSPAMAKLAAARLNGAFAADMRALPLSNGSVGGVLSFYSLIHLRRAELTGVLREFERVLRPGGRALFSAHEGRGEIEFDEFLGRPVPYVATLFELDELVEASRAAGLEVVLAERRPPYESEHETFRLYVEARRPAEVLH
jgi:SAM-dependent methyltransferase